MGLFISLLLQLIFFLLAVLFVYKSQLWLSCPDSPLVLIVLFTLVFSLTMATSLFVTHLILHFFSTALTNSHLTCQHTPNWNWSCSMLTLYSSHNSSRNFSLLPYHVRGSRLFGYIREYSRKDECLMKQFRTWWKLQAPCAQRPQEA
jgi:hypothetical protein